MTVFKTFLKIVKKYKFTIILYTVILVLFAGFNLQTQKQSTSFVESKPDIIIVNKDENIGITKDLIKYLKKNSNIVKVNNNKEAISDALFYRDANYIIYIPENYRNDYLNGLNPTIKIKTTGQYDSYLAENILKKYLKVANVYQGKIVDENKLIETINDTLKTKTTVKITKKIDTNALNRAAFYYNFLNYSILAGCVYVICLILSSFKEEKIKKRTIISSMNYKKLNKELLLSNGILAIILWLFYVILSYILIGDIVISNHGLLFILNSFVFNFCALTIAFLIGNLLNNKDAIDGIINVVALGSSFLCGSFVPVEWLPNSVLTVAHVLPSYWYIRNNELIKTIEKINLNSIKPVLINIVIILLFSILFIMITNMISKKKQKIK